MENKYIPKGINTCIIDLDETLVHTWENPKFIEKLRIYNDPQIYNKFFRMNEDPLCYSFDIPNCHIWGMYRPHMWEFLNFCDKYFDNVVIWSAGVEEYVYSIIKHIYKNKSKFPKVIWSRKNCTDNKNHYHKPIKNLINYINKKSYLPFQIYPQSTIIIDDKNYSFESNVDNGILIPPYDFPKTPQINELLNRNDHCLVDIMNWLQTDEVTQCDDVRNVNKNNIFIK